MRRKKPSSGLCGRDSVLVTIAASLTNIITHYIITFWKNNGLTLGNGMILHKNHQVRKDRPFFFGTNLDANGLSRHNEVAVANKATAMSPLKVGKPTRESIIAAGQKIK